MQKSYKRKQQSNRQSVTRLKQAETRIEQEEPAEELCFRRNRNGATEDRHGPEDYQAFQKDMDTKQSMLRIRGQRVDGHSPKIIFLLLHASSLFE